MIPCPATISASEPFAGILFGIQLGIALYESGKQLPPVPPFGLGPEADEQGWNRLYDLGVVHQLETWEQQGFRVHIEAGLPSAEKAAAAISECQSADSAGSREPAEPLILDEAPYGPWPETVINIHVEPNSLIAQLQQFFSDHCAWRSRDLFGADVFVEFEFEDEDATIDALAAFLWQHRRDFPGSTTGELEYTE
jgi:hypothetical protein